MDSRRSPDWWTSLLPFRHNIAVLWCPNSRPNRSAPPVGYVTVPIWLKFAVVKTDWKLKQVCCVQSVVLLTENASVCFEDRSRGCDVQTTSMSSHQLYRQHLCVGVQLHGLMFRTENVCINISGIIFSGSYCPGGPDSDFEYSTQSYTGYEVRSSRYKV